MRKFLKIWNSEVKEFSSVEFRGLAEPQEKNETQAPTEELLGKMGGKDYEGSLSILLRWICIAWWKLTKGIYRIDKTVYTDLVEKAPPKYVPESIVSNPPEWVTLIETPNDEESLGAAFFLTRTPETKRKSLCIVAFLREVEYSTVTALIPVGKHDLGDRKIDKYDRLIERLVAAYLFVCSVPATNKKKHKPLPPDNKRWDTTNKIKRARKAPVTWSVGVREGGLIRRMRKEQQSNNNKSTGNGGFKRPHLRRGHERQVWCGTGKSRHQETRWIPPCIVNRDKTIQIPLRVFDK